MKIKHILSIALVVMLLVAVAVLGVKLGKSNGSKLGVTAYEVGTIDSTTGKVTKDESKMHLVTKNYYKTNDFKISVAEDTELTYTLFFYNADKEYVGSTSSSAEAIKDLEVPEEITGAKFVKVQINSEEEIGLLGKAKLVKEIKVTAIKA